MTDAQKAELTRLARECLQADDKYFYAEETASRLLDASLSVDRVLSNAMLAADLDRIIIDDVTFDRDDDGITIQRGRSITLP